MIKKISLLAALSLLFSCNPAPQVGSDGYTFGKKQYEKTTVQIDIVTYKSLSDLQAALSKRAGVDKSSVMAFSVLTPPFDKCTIHMVDPAVKYLPEFAGHEMLHCVYGQWHTNNSLRG